MRPVQRAFQKRDVRFDHVQHHVHRACFVVAQHAVLFLQVVQIERQLCDWERKVSVVYWTMYGQTVRVIGPNSHQLRDKTVCLDLGKTRYVPASSSPRDGSTSAPVRMMFSRGGGFRPPRRAADPPLAPWLATPPSFATPTPQSPIPSIVPSPPLRPWFKSASNRVWKKETPSMPAMNMSLTTTENCWPFFKRASAPGAMNKKTSVGRDVYIRDWTGYRGVTCGKLTQGPVSIYHSTPVRVTSTGKQGRVIAPIAEAERGEMKKLTDPVRLVRDVAPVPEHAAALVDEKVRLHAFVFDVQNRKVRGDRGYVRIVKGVVEGGRHAVVEGVRPRG